MSDYTYLAVRPAARHSGTLGEGRTSFLLHRIYKSFSFFFLFYFQRESAGSESPPIWNETRVPPSHEAAALAKGNIYYARGTGV